MKNLLIKYVLGNDPLVVNMVQLLKTRAKLLSSSKEVSRLSSELTDARLTFNDYTQQHRYDKENFESSYNLSLV